MIGFINVYKPSGITSSTVVQKIKKHFHIDKVGHMGTLDPLAEGLLPIAIGKATRLFDHMLDKKKTYNVVFEFGYETDTLDITGVETKRLEKKLSVDDIKNNLSKMLGKQLQMPPKYSAKNINGARAYTLARSGIDFELSPKEIEIFAFELLQQVDTNKYQFKVVCSSGTYIRAVGRDFANILGTYATMTNLQRCDMGYFQLENSYPLDDILECEDLEKLLVSPLDVLTSFDKISIEKNIYFDLINGKYVHFNRISNNSFILYNDKLIGVAKPRENQLKIDCYLEEKI